MSIRTGHPGPLTWLSTFRPRQLRLARLLLEKDTRSMGKELTGTDVPAELLDAHRTFDFAFEPRYRKPLALLGIRPETTRIRIGPEHLHVRFGPFSVRTDLDNVAGAELTGPSSALTTIGVRVGVPEPDLTFGTSTLTGVCVHFHEPVRGLEPVGVLKHPRLTVTAVESRRLAKLLQEVIAAR